MQAETLNCPTCGAAVSKDATHCSFCEARLATVACPRCFAMMFVGSKFCPRCGAKTMYCGFFANNFPMRYPCCPIWQPTF